MILLAILAFFFGFGTVLWAGPLWVIQVRKVFIGPEFVPWVVVLACFALAAGLAILGVAAWLLC